MPVFVIDNMHVRAGFVIQIEAIENSLLNEYHPITREFSRATDNRRYGKPFAANILVTHYRRYAARVCGLAQ